MSAFEDLKDKPKKPKKQEDLKMQVDEKEDKFDDLKDKYDKEKDKFEKDKYKQDKDKYKTDKDKYKPDKGDKAKDNKADKEDKFKDKDKDGKDNKFKTKENKAKPDKSEKKKEKGEKFNKGGKDKVIKENKKRPKKKAVRSTWATYIHKVLKTVHEDECTLSSKAMQILDSFANDLFERISTEAVKLLRLNNKRTLTSMEIQTAARLVLPGELCKHAIQDGAKAVAKYQLAEP